MRKIFQPRVAGPPRVELCESCGVVCDAGCRARARHDRTRTTALARALGLR